jgi:SAM-dependent methyltransferase
MINNEQEYAKMADVEEHLWWYRCLHILIHRTIQEHFKGYAISIADAGCGTGGTMKFLSNKGYHLIQGFDISKYAIQICKMRGLDVFEENINNFSLYFPPDSLNVVICNDVFCYLNETERKDRIKDFVKSLRVGGIVLMNLPAFNFFGGIHDKAVGIKHRFSKKDAAMLFDDKTFFIKIMYWPFILSPLIYLIRLFQRLKFRYKKIVEVRSDIDLPPKWINEILFKIISVENRFFPWKPIGSSLYIVAQKIR